MPYASIDDLPPPLRAHLPPHAREIYLAAFNSAWLQYASRDPAQRERTAHRVAWAAVKHKYQKVGDRWIVRKSA
ncbi:ChaB family protein [Bradyrhizobium sp.]|uniref:ChaB family protein n=1 Tax=Bradyrhizobium sp. TaxID=376 RepID=UPI0025BAB350|nr:ChaB family protein [Bradyrhizobium sp.]